MKKIVTLLLTLIMLISLVGCSNSTDTAKVDTKKEETVVLTNENSAETVEEVKTTDEEEVIEGENVEITTREPLDIPATVAWLESELTAEERYNWFVDRYGDYFVNGVFTPEDDWGYEINFRCYSGMPCELYELILAMNVYNLSISKMPGNTKDEKKANVLNSCIIDW